MAASTSFSSSAAIIAPFSSHGTLIMLSMPMPITTLRTCDTSSATARARKRATSFPLFPLFRASGSARSRAGIIEYMFAREPPGTIRPSCALAAGDPCASHMRAVLASTAFSISVKTGATSKVCTLALSVEGDPLAGERDGVDAAVQLVQEQRVRRAHAVVHHRVHGALDAVHVHRVGVLLELELGARLEKRRREFVGRLQARVHALVAGDARHVVVNQLRRDLQQVVHLLIERLTRPQVVALRRLRRLLRRRRGPAARLSTISGRQYKSPHACPSSHSAVLLRPFPASQSSL